MKAKSLMRARSAAFITGQSEHVRIPLGPIVIHALSRERLIGDLLAEAFRGDTTRQVATANAQFYVLAESDIVFRDCLNRAEYVCADGISIKMAAKVLAHHRVERFAGVDLVQEICRRGSKLGLRVFLLGGRPESADRLAELLKRRFIGIDIAGTCCPPVNFEKSHEELTKVLEKVRLARAHLVFVALGAPKQELFIDQYLRNLKVPVAVGVGGSFEILIGVTHRAPKIIRLIGLEWFYRLCQEPRRLWRRYLLGNPHFLWIVLRYWLANLFRARYVRDGVTRKGVDTLVLR